jgi:hypothetical protein
MRDEILKKKIKKMIQTKKPTIKRIRVTLDKTK